MRPIAWLEGDKPTPTRDADERMRLEQLRPDYSQLCGSTVCVEFTREAPRALSGRGSL